MTMQEEIDIHRKWATRVMIDSGEFLPMVLIDCEIGRVPVMLTFESPAAKDANYGFIKLLALAHDATQLIMMSESWTTLVDPETGQIGERTEALTITVVQRDGERSVNLPILRSRDGKVSGLGEPELPDGENLYSRIGTMLPKEPVSQYQKDSARETLVSLGLNIPDMRMFSPIPTVH